MDASINKVIATLLIAFLSACSHTPPRKPLPPGGKTDGSSSLSVIADSQLHNIWGMGVKQSMVGSDIISTVAIRPPELNLLAPYVLQDLIEQMNKNKDKSSVMLVLGDSTNVACSGEFNDFARVMERARPGQLWLAVHGNHDTYLMGNLNTYGPKDFHDEWLPQMQKSAFPTDESWWGPSKIINAGFSSFLGRNWKDACYRDDVTYEPGAERESSPMNKVRWIAKYLKTLEPHGLILPPDAEAPESTNMDIKLSTQEGTALAAINYQVRGEWTRPDSSKPDFARSYKSFIVQAADVTPQHRLILIDTSVCESARGGPQFINAAGRKACLGREQLDVIGNIVDETPNDKYLVFAGHFPLHELDKTERRELIKIMKSHGNWFYMSGHKHQALHAYNWDDGIDLNIGSTTDWPMEAHRFYLDKSSGEIASRESFYIYSEPGLQYILADSIEGSEVCRHLPAAKALADLVPAEVRGIWESPPQKPCTLKRQRGWRDGEWEGNYQKMYSKMSEELRGYVNRIRQRFEDKNETEYRKIILRIAAAASEKESKTRDFVSVFGQ